MLIKLYKINVCKLISVTHTMALKNIFIVIVFYEFMSSDHLSDITCFNNALLH